MALYPETPIPQYPYDITEVWKTTITPFDSGREQRRQKQVFPKYDMAFSYNTLTLTEFNLLWNFYHARRGAYAAFYVYLPDPDPASWEGLGVGTGDGSTTIFDLPGKSASSQKIYINGEEQVVTVQYSILIGGGEESSDRVEFVTAPAENEIISCDFAGYMRNRCRFANDKMTRTQFAHALYSTGLELKGLAMI